MTRSRNETMIAGVGVYNHYSFDSNGQTLYASYSGPFPFKNRAMTDIVTPDFKEKIASGQIVNNPMNSQIITYTAEASAYLAISKANKNNGFRGSGVNYTYACLGWGALGSAAYVDITPLTNRAMLSAMSNIDKPDYEMLEDLLEIRQTVEFLRRPFQSLNSYTRKFLKKQNAFNRGKKGIEELKVLTDSWLQYRFAVIPLIHTIDNIYSSIVSPSVDKPKKNVRKRATGLATNEASTFQELTSSYWNVERNSSTTVTARACIIYEVINPINDWRKTYGLRGKDLPLGGWAIVPYSFMVDRVIDISSALRAMSNLADPNIVMLAGSTSYKKDVTRFARIIKQNTTAYDVSISCPGIYENILTYDRVPWIPSINNVIPGFKPAGVVDDITKITDLIALTSQNMRKVKHF